MTADLRQSGLQLQSLVTSSGTLQLELVDVANPIPGPDEVLVKVEAAPLNPSDILLLLGVADLSTARAAGTPDHPALLCDVPPAGLRAMSARLDKPLTAGNEGAGEIVAAGVNVSNALGMRVAMFGGEMYAQYRCLKLADCMVLPVGATSMDGASSFVNPLTALGMIETMRSEGHAALVHTAAASNLGQMLVKICLKDQIGLVNVVRSAGQAETLRNLGARYVCDSSADTFMADLIEAVAATGATIAFDAVGGGKLAGQILTAMEVAINRSLKTYSPYGSSVHKQVYIYGGLDMRPTQLARGFGTAWGIGGWLLFPFLQKHGAEGVARLQARISAELTTTFASHYTKKISLREAIDPEIASAWSRRATGEKFLIVPNKI